MAIENASNDGIGGVSCQTTYQRHSILGGTDRRRTTGWQVNIDFAESAARPSQSEMSATLFFVDYDDSFFKDCAK